MDNSQHIDLRLFFHQMMGNNSAITLVLVALAGAIWLIGANILVAKHYRRQGKSAWSGLKPFAFPFKDFNAQESLTLLALAITSLGLTAIALGFN